MKDLISYNFSDTKIMKLKLAQTAKKANVSVRFIFQRCAKPFPNVNWYSLF